MGAERISCDPERGGGGGGDTSRRSRLAFTAPVVLGAVLLAAPRAATGQAPEFGVGVARTQNPVETLSDELCPAEKTWAAEGRAGLRFSRAIALEGTVGYQWENADECANGLVPPIPDTGPHERTTTDHPAAGYPFVSTDMRLAFEPSNPSGHIWFRAFGGYGRMWSKDVGYWLAGAGVVFGGQLEALLDFEWNWFDLPFVATTESYVDGVLVDERVETGDTGHSTFRIKAGLRFRP